MLQRWLTEGKTGLLALSEVADMVAEDIRQVLVDLTKVIVREYERRQAEIAIVVTDVDAT